MMYLYLETQGLDELTKEKVIDNALDKFSFLLRNRLSQQGRPRDEIKAITRQALAPIETMLGIF
jgi:hypothetical protein